MKKRYPALIALLALFAAAPALAAPINIDLTTLNDPVSIVGIGVSVGDVEFYYEDYQGDSVDIGPGGVVGTAAEGTEGISGSLALSFLAGPVYGLAFDFFLGVPDAPDDFDLYVQLFGSDGIDLDPMEVAGVYDPDTGIVAGRVDRLGVQPFSVANVLFFGDASFFLIDNISYETAPVAPVPEPGSMLLLGAGLVLAASFTRRRR